MIEVLPVDHVTVSIRRYSDCSSRHVAIYLYENRGPGLACDAIYWVHPIVTRVWRSRDFYEWMGVQKDAKKGWFEGLRCSVGALWKGIFWLLVLPGKPLVQLTLYSTLDYS